MSQFIKVSCFHCGHGNELDLSLYGQGVSHICLYDKCDHCKKIYAFDVEACFKTVSFDAKW